MQRIGILHTLLFSSLVNGFATTTSSRPREPCGQSSLSRESLLAESNRSSRERLVASAHSVNGSQAMAGPPMVPLFPQSSQFEPNGRLGKSGPPRIPGLFPRAASSPSIRRKADMATAVVRRRLVATAHNVNGSQAMAGPPLIPLFPPSSQFEPNGRSGKSGPPRIPALSAQAASSPSIRGEADMATAAGSTSLQRGTKTTTTRAAAKDVITKRVNWHSANRIMIYLGVGTVAAVTLVCIKCGCIIKLIKQTKRTDPAQIHGYTLVPQSELNSAMASATKGPPFSS